MQYIICDDCCVKLIFSVNLISKQLFQNSLCNAFFSCTELYIKEIIEISKKIMTATLFNFQYLFCFIIFNKFKIDLRFCTSIQTAK